MSWLVALAQERSPDGVVFLGGERPSESAPNGRSVAADTPSSRPSDCPHSVHEIRAQIDPDERLCSQCQRPALSLNGDRLCEFCAGERDRESERGL